MGDGLLIRRAEPADRPEILRLLASTLGWLPDEHHAAFFEWKHDRNPFGPSPAWVAVDEATGILVGFRTFLRWRFERDGEVVRAVRAVDTATDPAHQGRGIFTRLTRHALAELRDEGVAFVFNTPNDQSRPGYLKMGWELVGRVPLSVRPRLTTGALRVLWSREPADLWSQACDAGVPAVEAIDDVAPVARSGSGDLCTVRSPEVLRWRYGFPPLAYRAVGVGGALAVVRLRRRGAALEAAVCDVLAGAGEAASLDGIGRAVARETGADYAIATRVPSLARAGFLPVPVLGPILTWRPIADNRRPPLRAWRLALGDVELL